VLKGLCSWCDRGRCAWRGEIYVVREGSLAVLEAHNISYERLRLPLQLSEADVERDTLV